MSPNEQLPLQKLYASWPTERLARAVTKDKGDYQPDAVALMLEELGKRELAGDAIEQAVVPPPLSAQNILLSQRDTWLLPARLDRLRYAIRTSVFVIVMIAAGFCLELVPAAEPASFIVLLLGGLLYGALGLLLPRSRDAGLPSWMAVIFGLFPITAFITFIVLLFTPSKR